jgi:hypothetical protein
VQPQAAGTQAALVTSSKGAERLLSMNDFVWNGRSFPYYRQGGHNDPRGNERTVELPLAFDRLASFAGKRILEVGAVTCYYYGSDHRIVDPYDGHPAAEAVDLFDVRGVYDLVLAISTIEHVGLPEYGETRCDIDLALHAVDHLMGLVAPGGECFYTFPRGHHWVLDLASFDEVLPGQISHLRRANAANDWIEETDREVIGSAAYGRPFPWGNQVTVVRWTRPA